ncbi:MAG TPA: nitroreductase [Moraxellaceae bacterium]|nr:nitroreductase [Moraxellaceae bacterium]
MQTLDAILSRISQGKLADPAPDNAALERAFACALRAPDHRVLRPWRYLVLRGEALQQLGDVFVDATRANNPALDPVEVERLRKMPLRAPLIVVAVTVHKQDPKVPEEELYLSTGAAVQNFMLALHDQGFATMWRTGPLAKAPLVRAALGLSGQESISGFLYVGTAAAEPRRIVPLAVDEFVSEWKG